MVVFSLLVHLTMFVLLTRANFFPGLKYPEAPVYYVDVVNLPVASPRAGSPAAAPGPATATPPPRPAQREMTLPAAPPAKAKPTAPTTAAPKKAAQEATEFEERLQNMARKSEARREAADLEAAINRIAGKGRTASGMPGGTGTEPGSDYGSYIRSRLEDAFRKEDTFKPGPGKFVIVHLTIDRNGRIIGQRYAQRSTDPVFNDAVSRAIGRAEKEFRPPPGGRQFEQDFTFKPQQGVGKK
jgi:colicin import membrane protein